MVSNPNLADASSSPWGQNNTITLKQIKSTITIIKTIASVFRVLVYLSRTPSVSYRWLLFVRFLSRFHFPAVSGAVSCHVVISAGANDVADVADDGADGGGDSGDVSTALGSC